MKKRLITYLLKGMIALGTAGFLNGIATKIFEQNTEPTPVQQDNGAARVAVEESKDDTLEMPHGLQTEISQLPVNGSDIAVPMLPHEYTNEPKNTVNDKNEFKMDEGSYDAPDKGLENALVVTQLPPAIVSAYEGTNEEELAQKHRKNYTLPHVYTKLQTSQKDSEKKDTAKDESAAFDEKPWNGGDYQGGGSYGSIRNKGGYASSGEGYTPSDKELADFMRIMSNSQPSSSTYQGAPSASYAPQTSSQSGRTGSITGSRNLNTDLGPLHDAKNISNNTGQKNVTTPLNSTANQAADGTILPYIDAGYENGLIKRKNGKKLKQEIKEKQDASKEVKEDPKGKLLEEKKAEKITEHPLSKEEVAALEKRAQEMWTKFEKAKETSLFDQTVADEFIGAKTDLIAALKQDPSRAQDLKALETKYKGLCDNTYAIIEKLTAAQASPASTKEELEQIEFLLGQLVQYNDTYKKILDACQTSGQADADKVGAKNSAGENTPINAPSAPSMEKDEKPKSTIEKIIADHPILSGILAFGTVGLGSGLASWLLSKKKS